VKILLISSTALVTPPKNYGGLERVAYEHAQGLEELGHEVTLVAAKGSTAPKGVKLMETVEPWNKLNEAQQKQYGKADRVWNGWRAQEEEAWGMYKDRPGAYDVVGDMSWSKWSYLSRKEEIVGTCHSIKPYNVKPPREYPMFAGVSRGHSRFLAKEMHQPVRTLWNPVDLDEIPMERQKGDRILSLNRIMPQKGIHYFIDVCEKLKVKGDIAGDDSTLVPDQGYVQMIKQRVAKSAQVTYHGLVDDKKRVSLLQNAKALLCFIDAGYQEIFGLQAVEALAAGTPVIAARTWGFEDTVEQGKTGFLCSTVDEAVDATSSIMLGTVNLRAEDCRKGAEEFSRQKCAKLYERVFQRVKDGCRW